MCRRVLRTAELRTTKGEACSGTEGEAVAQLTRRPLACEMSRMSNPSVPENQTIHEGTLLRPGDVIPHFEGFTTDGRLEYGQLWQRRNLVLFVLPLNLHNAARTYLGALDVRLSELRPDDTTLVHSDRALERLPLGTLVIADRWGEIAHLQDLASDMAAWPSIDDVLDWVEFIQMKCPECPP